MDRYVDLHLGYIYIYISIIYIYIHTPRLDPWKAERLDEAEPLLRQAGWGVFWKKTVGNLLGFLNPGLGCLEHDIYIYI